MIYTGYQGIGKSAIAGKDTFIDLESGNFWIDGKRDDNWFKIYCNIAIHLSNQGYTVLMSSHKAVRDEFNSRNQTFVTISPAPELEEQWIERLQKRYDNDKSEKNYKALENAKDKYQENTKELRTEKNSLVISTIDYDLSEVIDYYETWATGLGSEHFNKTHTTYYYTINNKGE